VAPDMKAREAVDVMVRKKLRALPVVGEKGEVLGIITEWDVMRKLLPHIPSVDESATTEDNEDELVVRDVMTRSVLCVSEDMGLEEAVNLMINKKVEQTPVVKESVFTGMLTRTDIIHKLFARK
jgi:CBS domain-containing protein